MDFLFLVLMSTTISVYQAYAGGPRLDSSDLDPPIPGSHECWVDGFDAGFAGKYDKNRADECVDKADEYNGAWKYGCDNGVFTKDECNDIKNNSDDDLNHAAMQEENRRSCYDDGYEDGEQENPVDRDRQWACDEFGGYDNGFIAGCMSIEGNTDDSCDLIVEGPEDHCPNNPDNPDCTEFLHNDTNKLPVSYSGSICDQEPVDPGCLQSQDPERYCLTTNDPVFCKSIGDICDIDGFVKPEDAYCKIDDDSSSLAIQNTAVNETRWYNNCMGGGKQHGSGLQFNTFSYLTCGQNANGDKAYYDGFMQGCDGIPDAKYTKELCNSFAAECFRAQGPEVVDWFNSDCTASSLGQSWYKILEYQKPTVIQGTNGIQQDFDLPASSQLLLSTNNQTNRDCLCRNEL
jgi:hypothetical protein